MRPDSPGSTGPLVAAPRGRASLADVAARAGVSISTVSRIANGVEGRAAAETVERVRLAMSDLDYRPDSAGRTLRQRQSRSVGVIAANLSNPVMTTVVASLEASLRDIGYGLVLADSRDQPDIQDDCLFNMRAQLVRTIILVGAVASPGLDAFRAGGESLLFVMRTDPSGAASPYVGIDNRAAGVDAADHLLRHGARRFGAVHSSLTSSAIAARLAGFADRLAAAGVPRDAIALSEGTGAEHLAIGYSAMDRLLAAGPPPDGLLCVSDLIAYGAHRRLTEAGLSVPGDVRLVGIDGNPLNAWLAPWLASVHAPYDAFGPEVVAMLESLWAGTAPAARILRTELVTP
jgi:LacI family transcriptional regulator